MITQAVCNSFKAEILRGVHREGDVYKIALFKASAQLSDETTTYTPTDEVSGKGYVAGGLALQGFVVNLIGKTALIDWTTDPEWPDSTITARGGLIYNSSRENRAVAVLDFGSLISSTNGPFRVQLPAATATAAIVRVK